MQQASSLLFSGPDEVVASRDDVVMVRPPCSDIDPCPDDLEAIFGAANDVDQISASSFEMIYGVCQSLVYLLQKTTRLMLADFDPESTHTSPNGSRLRLYKETEAEVLEWPVEKKIAILRTAPTTPGNLLIMEHYSRAFHHALIIFWHCRIRKMHRRYVQPYVAKVLLHLEHIERVKHEFGIRSGRMPWPAFVAASQAIDAEVRARFLTWFDNMAEEGMGSSRISKEALVAIWRQNKDAYSLSSRQTPKFVLA
jgi:arginine metabolism regulation protein II